MENAGTSLPGDEGNWSEKARSPMVFMPVNDTIKSRDELVCIGLHEDGTVVGAGNRLECYPANETCWQTRNQ